MPISLDAEQTKNVKQIIAKLGSRISPNQLAFLLKRHLKIAVTAEQAGELLFNQPKPETGMKSLQKEARPKDLRAACMDIINEVKETLREEGVHKLDNIVQGDLSALLFLSDLHLGEKVEINETEVFNLEIATERLGQTVSNFIIAPELDGYEVEEAIVILGGDIIDGEMIYPAHAFETESHVFNQVKDATSIIWTQLSRIAEVFPVVKVYCVPGNHGRSSKLHHQMSNWDNVLYYGLQLMANMAKVNIEVHTPSQMWMDFKVRNWTVHLRHIGVTQAVTAGPAKKVLTWMENHNADLMFYGHFHSPELYSMGHRRVFKNGALPPMNDFAENLGFQEGAGQWMLGITDKDSVAFAKILLPE